MAGPWDDFKQSSADGPWSEFQPQPAAPVRLNAIEAPTAFETWLAKRTSGNDVGNLRGTAIGRVAQGLADPGAAIVQMGANLIPGAGEAVNKRIAEVESQYQSERARQGSTGFDPLRLAGNVAMTLPAGGAIAAPASIGGRVLVGAGSGAAASTLNPITNGGESFWMDKAKEAAIGAVTGGLIAPLAAGVSRLVSPKASTNADVELLRREGVQITPGQAAGGWVNRAEELAQSIPVLGDAITSARQNANELFNKAALNRAMKPIGKEATETGSAGIEQARKALGDEYDKLLPKMAVNIGDPNFVQRVSSLRSMVQTLPETEAKQFDNIIAREIDKRVSPNGILSAQNLQDAKSAIEREAADFARSTDKYQRDLGLSLKQLGQELRTHIEQSNPQFADQLRQINKGYANFKRVQRAGASVGAAGGESSPSQLYSAVKALDKSKDKSQFASDKALMQDLAGAGKRVMGSTVRNSGTADRVIFGGGLGAVATGAVNPAIPAAALAGAGAYAIPQVRNALVELLTNRPDYAPQLANTLRSLTPQLSVVAAPAISGQF